MHMWFRRKNSSSGISLPWKTDAEKKTSPLDQVPQVSGSASILGFHKNLTVKVPPNPLQSENRALIERKFTRAKPSPQDPHYKEKVFFQEMEENIFFKLENHLHQARSISFPNSTDCSPCTGFKKLTVSPTKGSSNQLTNGGLSCRSRCSSASLENGGLSPQRRASVTSTPSYSFASPKGRASRQSSQSAPAEEVPQSKLICNLRDQLDWTCYVGGFFNTASREQKDHNLHTSSYLLKDKVIKAQYKYLIRQSQSLPQRRNSTNSLPLCYCQTDGTPDPFALMKAVCVCLHYHIVCGSEKPFRIHPDFALFDDRAMKRAQDEDYDENNPQVPSLIDVYMFYKYIFKTAQLERDCIVMSLIYIDRLLSETVGKLKICQTNWKSIVLSGTILASKVWDDLSMWNCDFSEVGRLNLKRINQLEAALLTAIQFNVRVSACFYARYYYHLRSWCVRFGIGTAQERTRQTRAQTDVDIDVGSTSNIATKHDPDMVEVTYGVTKRKCLKKADTVASLEEVVEISSVTHPGGIIMNPMSVYEYRCQHQVTSSLDPQELLCGLVMLEQGGPERNYVLNSTECSSTEHTACGCSGTVNIVKHKKSGIKYALKTLNLNRMLDLHRLDELRNEIEIMSMLNHPNITRLMEVYEEPGEDRISLVLEVCTGPGLLVALHRQRFFSEQACSIMMRQMLSAVRHCHSHKIVHRDLKLESWMFEAPSRTAALKLIEFGFSRHFRQGEILHLPVGTPYTVAPEVLSGAYTQHCDMWSMGVIAFMLLYGKPPFQGSDEYELLQNVKKGSWVLPDKFPDGSRCSPDTAHFLKSLLTPDLGKRLSAKAALQHPFILAQKQPLLQLSLCKKVRNSLLAWRKLTNMMKLVYNLIAYTIDPLQVDEIKHQFQAMDVDCDGEISIEDLRNALGGVASEHEIQQIFEDVGIIPNDRDSCFELSVPRIRYNDFLAANLQDLAPRLSDLYLRTIYEKIDRSHAGVITYDDLRCFLGEELTEEEISVELEKCGLLQKDGRSQIEYEQFCSALRRGGIISK